MNLNKYILNIFPYLFFLVFVYSISYRMFGGIVGTSDFPYLWPESSLDSFSTWNNSYLGYNRSSAMFGLQFFKYQAKFLSFIGFNNIISSYIINYGIVYLCSIVYYWITKKISNNSYLAYGMGLFIILNNFVLEHFLVFPGFIFYSLIGYGITLYILYRIYLNGTNSYKLISLSLVSFFHFHPFFIIINILLLNLFFLWYIIFHSNKNIKKNTIFYIVLIFIICFGQSYWLFPFLYNTIISTSSSVYGADNQLAVFSGYLQSVSYINLFNLYHYPGILGIKLHGSILQNTFYSITLSILVLIFLVKRNENSKFVLWLFSIMLIYFTLALGPKSIITGDIWLYFYNNFSIFGFFRSFSRFIILYLVILIFIIIFISTKFNNSKIKNGLIMGWVILMVISNRVFFSGDLGGFIKSAKVPQEYIEINKKYFVSDPNQYNILTLPNVSYESYTWFSVDKTTRYGENIRQSVYFREMFFSKPSVYNRYAVNLDQKHNFFSTFYSYEGIKLGYDEFNRALDIQNIKYILVQKDMTDLVKDNTLIDTTEIIEYLDKNIELIKKENNSSFVLYENTTFYPIIQGKNTTFAKVNDSQYTIQIKEIQEDQTLDFLQSYDTNWAIRVQQVDNKKPNIYTGTLLNKKNTLAYDYANQWTIDPEYIKANFDKSYYKENLDGSIDIELTLYFKPQSYFYLGIIISGTTLILCLGYLGYAFYRKRGVKGLSTGEQKENIHPRLAGTPSEGGQIKGKKKNKSKSVIKIKK